MEQTNETIVSKAYDLIKYSLPILNKMPKDQRYLLGDRIQTMLSDLLERFFSVLNLLLSEKSVGLPLFIALSMKNVL